MHSDTQPAIRTPRSHTPLFAWLSLLIILLLAGYFRFTGLFWGDYEYPHPDERFLIWVVADIAPVDSLAGYFDTAQSTLNPANRGHEFYVYGDFPVISVRYLTEALFEQHGWEQILQTGRGLSAVFDILSVLLIFLITERLAGWKPAALAGLLGAAAVLNIQQSHFFTSDTFSTFFTTLAVYLAVLIATQPPRERPGAGLIAPVLVFGVTVGLAMACKINTAPVAALLPAALLFYWLRLLAAGAPRLSWEMAGRLAALAVLSGALALLAFRIFQPYAFAGPGFFDMRIDEGWLKSINDLRAQSAGDVDFPPALQWARRNHLFSLKNLVLWGLGLPMGIAAWLGFFLVLARLVQRLRLAISARHDLLGAAAAFLAGPWAGVLIVWGWTAVYFTWQSMAWNPTMRYQLPIYPTLAVLAGWGLNILFHLRPRTISERPWRLGVFAAGTLVALLTLAWAFAFTRIYTRSETRVAASRWILSNVPGPLNLSGTSDTGPWTQMVGAPSTAAIAPGEPYLTYFDARESGVLSSVYLQSAQVISASASGSQVRLRARVYDPADPQVALAVAEINLDGSAPSDGLQMPAAVVDRLEGGRRYALAIDVLGSTDTGATVSISGQMWLDLYTRAQSVTYQSGSGEMAPLTLEEGGMLRLVSLPEGMELESALVTLQNAATGEQKVAFASVTSAGTLPVMEVEPALEAQPGVGYLVKVETGGGRPLEGDLAVQLHFLDRPVRLLLPELTGIARPVSPIWASFTAHQDGALEQVRLLHAAQLESSAAGGMALNVYARGDVSSLLAQARVANLPTDASDPRGGEVVFTFDPPLALKKDTYYAITLTPDSGAVSVRGSAVANESTWDMGLPFRLDNYDPFGGLYRGDLNFEMYWDDNTDKLQRFLNNLDQADYIFFSSNRQWGTTTRIPERYPLTTQFYRSLLGCPGDKDVIWCYNVAEPGMFEGQLGYDLVQTFTSYPNLGPLEINTQFAEEAFTVYDHPKVMIFQKRADYSSARALDVLGAVDLDAVVHLSPKKAAGWRDMLLTERLRAVQQAGGTWAKLFPPESLLNRFPWLGLAVWYVFFFALGALTYPLARLALPHLPDRGYTLARTSGMVISAYLAWILGSAEVIVSRGLLLGLFLALVALGLYAAWRQAPALRAEWRERRGYFLRVEVLALALFAVGLLLRLGNPDLWHPIYGGEKPMDFSYFNAVLKSSVFPPYDPWFAGGTINYYYYGYVLVGMPVKLLGITPSVAYNLILPMLFCLTGLGAFGLVYNLAAHREIRLVPRFETIRPFGAGLIAVAALLIIGNLGTVRMLWQGWQRMVVSEEEMRAGTLVQQVGWAAEGIGKLLSDENARMPYYTGDWYWKPSRAIQPEANNEITEFPFFTFIYGDLHAHLIALPVTLLVLGWALSVALRPRRAAGEDPGWLSSALSLAPAILLGALASGSLRPTNTWDQYTFLTLAALALLYGQWRAEGGGWLRRVLYALVPAAALVLLALLFYRPFDAWFVQGYNALELWTREKTGLSSYLVHWGLFLFVITAWLWVETLDWMARTPVSALNKLRAHREALLAALAFFVVLLVVLVTRGIWIALIVVPLGAWVVALILRPGQSEPKRAVLFLTGTALTLTLAVELVAVKGDIGRMNTVFKFYYQAWTLLSLSAAAALVWLGAPTQARPRAGWRTAWLVVFSLLVAGAVLFPLMASRARFSDRMVNDAPRGLDGMEYMAHATYTDGETAETSRELDLSEDYRAIRWMQQNVPGSPVIVEAHTPEYRHWGTRFTIYTGLPGVVGWNWHQRQQRTATPDTWVYARVDAVGEFYRTPSAEVAAAFLRRYDVQYIIVGQLERTWYAATPGTASGLDKFEALNGQLWDEVYREGETVIYKVR